MALKSEEEEYNQFVSGLIDRLQESHRNVCDIGFGKGNTVAGKSGRDHPLDLSFIDRDFVRPTLVLLDCETRNRRLELDRVEAMLDTQLDILHSVNQYLDVGAIIVGTSGMTGDARQFATQHGITLDISGSAEGYSFDYASLVESGFAGRD